MSAPVPITTYAGHPRRPGPILGWPASQTIMSCQHVHGPLLTRYYLLSTTWLSIYLHHLIASDEDRALHDHPWSFISVLLTRGYWEITPTGRHWRRWLSVLWRPAAWLHRLELTGPTWTLVFRFRRVRQWGFLTPAGWRDWLSYGKVWCD